MATGMKKGSRGVLSWGRHSALWMGCLFILCCLSAAQGEPTLKWANLSPKNFDLKDPKIKKQFEQLNQVHKDVVAGKAPLAASVKEFENYYRLTFRLMTDPSPAQLTNLQRIHRELIKELATAPPEVRTKLRQLTEAAMSRVADAKTNCHPAVRYTALLILGDLNDREEVTSGQPAPALPSASAFKVLLRNYDDPNQIDAARLAAMVGMLRHSQLHAQKPFMEEAKQTDIRDRMITLLTATEIPPGRTADGHRWMLMRAADILGTLGFQGESGGKSLAALVQVISNRKQSIDIRCNAAAALGAAPLPANATLDPVAVAKELGTLARAACVEQLVMADKQLTKSGGAAFGGGGGGVGPGAGMMMGAGPGAMTGPGGGVGPRGGVGPPGGRGGYGMAGGMGVGGMGVGMDMTDPRIDKMRRRLRKQLTGVQYAFNGATKGAGIITLAKQESQKTEVTAFVDAIAAVLKVIDDEGDDFQKLIKDTNSALLDLDKIAPDVVASN